MKFKTPNLTPIINCVEASKKTRKYSRTWQTLFGTRKENMTITIRHFNHIVK